MYSARSAFVPQAAQRAHARQEITADRQEHAHPSRRKRELPEQGGEARGLDWLGEGDELLELIDEEEQAAAALVLRAQRLRQPRRGVREERDELRLRLVQEWSERGGQGLEGPASRPQRERGQLSTFFEGVSRRPGSAPARQSEDLPTPESPAINTSGCRRRIAGSWPLGNSNSSPARSAWPRWCAAWGARRRVRREQRARSLALISIRPAPFTSWDANRFAQAGERGDLRRSTPGRGLRR